MAPMTRSQAAARKIFKFPFFPTELRLMIWCESFEPRILHITSETINLPEQVLEQPSLSCRRLMPVHFRFKCREKPPIALHICHESRALALKHYTPSFHSSTFPLECASEVKQTALYFNPELDTVHILNARFTGIWIFSCRTRKETIQSIKVLAIGSHIFQDMGIQHIAGRLPAFKKLETLVLVTEREAGRSGKELVRVNIENELVKVQDQLTLRENSKEWKLPVVKVMSRRNFENKF